MFDETTYGWGIAQDWTNFLGPLEEMDQLVSRGLGLLPMIFPFTFLAFAVLVTWSFYATSSLRPLGILNDTEKLFWFVSFSLSTSLRNHSASSFAKRM